MGYKDNKTDRPVCWDWEIPDEVWYLSARAKTSKDFKSLLSLWGKGCAICGAFEDTDLDHDHATNLVRGMLCHSCNIAEGHKNTPLLDNYRHINPAFILGVEIQYVPGHKTF